MSSGPKRCGNCRYFNPERIFNGHKQTSHCGVRDHNYYGSLVPGDEKEDKSSKPRQTKLAVTADCNSRGGCDIFEPDHERVKEWRKSEEKAAEERRTHKAKELKG